MYGVLSSASGPPCWRGDWPRQGHGRARRAPLRGRVGSLPCPQTFAVGSRLAGREMGLGEGVGWQEEGTGLASRGVSRGALACHSLFIFQHGSYARRSGCVCWGKCLSQGGTDLTSSEGLRPDNTPRQPHPAQFWTASRRERVQC